MLSPLQIPWIHRGWTPALYPLSHLGSPLAHPVQFSRSVVSDSATPWIAACQAFLSITNSQSSLTHDHWVNDAIQLSHPLLSPSPPASNLSQHQGLFKWVSSHQVAKVVSMLTNKIEWLWKMDEGQLPDAGKIMSKGNTGIWWNTTVLLITEI